MELARIGIEDSGWRGVWRGVDRKDFGRACTVAG